MEQQTLAIKKYQLLFWLTVFFILGLQTIYTFHSMGQIRYEELAESVRNVWWLQNKTIYDGVSSNVGWYGTVLLLYHTFGFSLFLAKFYRLALFAISILCLAAVLKKYLGPIKSIVPLLAIGLSPTLLFFNTLQTSYGLDIQYLFICMYLLSVLNFAKPTKSILIQLSLGFLSMVAIMSYPTFLFYLPALGIYYLVLILRHSTESKALLKNLLITLFSFALPLVMAFIYVKDITLLLNDSISGSGIFRGAGSLNFDPRNFYFNISHFFIDLFIKPNSYYFDFGTTDFSNFYPIPGIMFALGLGIWMIIKKKNRLILGLMWLVFLTSLIFANLTVDPSTKPGIRRSTGLLISIYGLYIFAWYFITSNHWKNSMIKIVLAGLLFLVSLHHLLSFPANLSELSQPSIYRYGYIFGVKEKPNESLTSFINTATSENLKLACQDKEGNLVTCRYSESYAAVAGACYWNHLPCQPILGYDSKAQQYIPLSTFLWENYYWSH